MKIIIQKFGGTSVSNVNHREMVIKKILQAKNDGYSPVVVVSAMGRKGDPYATDTLLSLIDASNTAIDKRETDMLMSCGEIISACVLYSMLKSRGVKCIAMTGGQAGIVTDDSFGSASVIKVNADNIYNYLTDGFIPIIAGFQGVTETGNITTLGRGGSDTTAAILGEALKAKEIEIFTDVDGIMTADPRIVPDAKVIGNMTYNEVFQFADEGAKVIHPRAVELAMRSNIPLVIKNTMSDAPGTFIANNYKDGLNKHLVTGITYMPNRTQVSIENDAIDTETVFNNLAENKISIDLINIFPTYSIFTIDKECTEKAVHILNKLNIKYRITENCSKVSVIGSSIRGIPGVMARIIKAMKRNNINILQTSDSHTTIWCLVKYDDTVKSINALHKEFGLSD
ncbi:MAG: aspartate kinase [Clostridiales bacterium]|nr:aspartate kinase [Clostridiales bacterium]HBM81230.1 aspartate kinase [Clostridiaceae bacterium]